MRRRNPEKESALLPEGGTREGLICSKLRGKAASVLSAASAECLKCLALARKTFHAFLSVELILNPPSVMNRGAVATPVTSRTLAVVSLGLNRIRVGFSGTAGPLRGTLEKK